MFLAFFAAEKLKNAIPAPLVVGGLFLVFLAAQNLKNTIPAPLVVGRVERESCFWRFKLPKSSKIRFPPLWAWDGLSGNRVFGVFSCRKTQKYDSRSSGRGTG